jgi:AraC-type DNA-binding domain-containing proteins
MMELHRFYQYYDIDIPYQTKLPRLTFSKMIYLVGLLAELITQKKYDEEELIYGNQFFQMAKEDQQQEQFLLEIKEEEEEQYHHTYQEEEKVLNCIREGRVDDAVRYSKYMDEYLGKMSNNKLNQWRNAAIVSITLSTRAAIQGGVSPATAYRLSDYYISKCDSCVNIVMLMEFRNHAIEELTERVRIRQKDYSGSSYIEKCKDYIRKHYHEKIYLKDIAEEMGLSISYLSRLFRRETGVRIQDYIIQFRVERAANLLLYSEKSIAAISEYVNLTSQSYFSSVFKKYKGMTPKKYRDKYKPVEFIGKKNNY